MLKLVGVAVVLLAIAAGVVLYLRQTRGNRAGHAKATNVQATGGERTSASSGERWDFYLCKVDDAPASIFLDMSLHEQLPSASENTLYAVQIEMSDSGDHGMGTAAEADVLHPIEDVIVSEMNESGLRYLGRLRNLGMWQLTFMGPIGREDDVRHAATSALASPGRSFELIARQDADWSYYRDFLYPDAERVRWMRDRDVVDALEQHGDSLRTERRVDHWVYFGDVESRSRFAEAVHGLGFGIVELDASSESGPGLQVHRVDSVQLDDIHEVTTTLQELAERYGGEYDGWETSVEGTE